LKPKERNILANEARATDLAKAVITDNSWDKLPYFCPTGWHVPSDTDWITLFDYAGGYEYSIGIFYNENSVGTTYYGFKDEGISVRCLKN
jgi:uncharacterized protein (TIGR02145 family)